MSCIRAGNAMCRVDQPWMILGNLVTTRQIILSVGASNSQPTGKCPDCATQRYRTTTSSARRDSPDDDEHSNANIDRVENLHC